MTQLLRLSCVLAIAGQLYPAFGQSGSIDDGFAPPGFGETDNIQGVVALPDGRLLVFGTLAGHSGLMRLLPNGQVDPAFQAELPPASTVFTCAPLANGGVLVGLGQGLTRLDAEGHADPTLILDYPLSNFTFTAIAVQPDGKILVGGTYYWAPYRRITRIHPDGSLDTSFDPGTSIEGLTGWVASIAFQPDGKILIGGGMSGFDGPPASSSGLCRLYPEGNRDLTFNLTPGVESLGYGASLTQLAVLPDGKILTAGNFHTMNGVPRHNMARLNNDGTLDGSFDIGTGFTAPGPPTNNYSSTVSSFAVQADGRILVAGAFTAFNGIACPPLVRLEADGTLDPSFSLGTTFQQRVPDIALQPDGKVVAAGQFNGTGPVIQLARLQNCFAGATCDDGLAYTENDLLNAACQCAGTPVCVPSQLTATADPLVSCGATGLRLDGTSAIHASLVPGANRYQFRFTNVPGQPVYSRNIAIDSRSLTLTKWTTLPLKKGRSYRVTVRASFNQGATYCDVGGTCTIGIANYPEQRMAWAYADEPSSSPDITLFPVPYTSGPLMLRVSDLETAEPLQVRMVNATGQEVSTTRYSGMGEEGMLPVPVDRTLVPGLYFVELTSGDQRFVERLLVH